jgi:hypothetical protein
MLLPWMIFSFAYFGSPFPNTISAKTVAYVVTPGLAFQTLFPNAANPFFEAVLFGPIGFGFAILNLLLSLFGLLFTARNTARLLPLLIYPFAYIAAFSIANPLIFRWYVVPPLPGLMLSLGIGAWSVISGLQKRAPRIRSLTPVALGMLGIFWILTSLSAWTLHPDQGAPYPAPRMAFNGIELNYEGVARRLVTDYGVTPQTIVASADIGTIGYFTRAQIIDTVGLVTPALSKYYPFPRDILVPGQNYAITPQLILDTQPEYFISMEAFVRLGLEQNPAFKAQYGDPIIVVPTTYYGTDMRAYKRK